MVENVAVVSCRPLVGHAWLTARAARHVGHPVVVVDLDGSFPPVAGVRVVSPGEIGLDEAQVRRVAARRGPDAAARLAAPAAAAPGAVVLEPGLVLQAPWADWAVPSAPSDGEPVPRAPEHAGPVLSAATLTPRSVVTTEPEVRLDGRPVAVDLTGLDLGAPWLLDARRGDAPGRLSDHPALAAWVAVVAATARAVRPLPGRWDPGRTVLGGPVHPLLRELADEPGAPDLLAGDPEEVEAWLTGPVGGVPRYLAALRRRPDLDFPATAEGDAAYLDWCDRFGRVDGEVDPDLVARCLERVGRPAPVPGPPVRRPMVPAAGTRPPGPGVNVVGFLGGDLGIGESARLMIAALEAAGVPHRAVPVDRLTAGAGRSPGAASDAPAADRAGFYDTTLVCVNADLTGAAAAAEPELFARTYRVGMWYWEVEDFPATQHGGFDNVDEVWVATEFVRAAVEPHAPVPVRVVMPPLPQARPAPAIGRDEIGLPAGFTFLFVFDHLSTTERKNPWGLVEAFTRAFGPEEDVSLVVKSLNAERRPADAERLRLAAAPHPRVHLDERRLTPAERDALVAHAEAYVSLHRSEGLGLTMAEAMARGKPVVATGYGGNLAFMTEENSYLVPWAPVPIGHAPPYPPGAVWADPDLDAAGAAMRAVVDDPAGARARGERAARDVAEHHSPEAAAAGVLAALDASADRRRERLRIPLRRRVGRVVRALGLR